MSKIKKTAKLVKELLRVDPKARNSDGYLYLKVLELMAGMEERPIRLEEMTVPYFLLNIRQLNYPCFETVRRTRAKIQSEHPELRASAEIEAKRQARRKEFKAFAREKT